MAVYIACCLPDGSCQSLICDQFNNCIEQCGALGGAQYGGATVFADACDFYSQNLPPGSTLCGVGRCEYTPNGSQLPVCEEITYADCVHRSEQYVFQHGLTCPQITPRNRAIKAFLNRERTWPYRAEWSLAASGLENVCCVPGLEDCQLWTYDYCQEVGGVWTPTTLARERGTGWPWYLDPDFQVAIEPAQMARMFLDRRMRCWAPDFGSFLPYDRRETCEANQGIWRWDGIPYLAPAVGHIFTEIRDCVKRIKLFQQLGFWFPDEAATSTGCYDRYTFAPHGEWTTQSSCEAAGHVWREAAFIAPPQWSGQVRYSTKTPVVPSPEHYFKHSKYAEEYPHAAEFQYMLLLPVDPIESLPPECCTGGNFCVPYCNDPAAPSKFPFTDTRTYEIPCYTFNHTLYPSTFVSGVPFRNRSFGDGLTEPTIPAGLKAVVAYSGGDALVGSLRNYCGSGCPQDFDCEATKCEDMWENIYRKYTGITAPAKFVWEDDPQGRGWAVTYTTIVKGWFVQDSLWDLQPLMLPGAPQVPSFRWNAWYEGETRCVVSGDLSDPTFNSWVLSHDSGFGLKFYPRYAACNDVFQRFEGLGKALGDEIFPSALAQEQCLDQSSVPPNQPGPCKRIGKLSKWYRPSVTGAPEPQQGLYHETERIRYLDKDHSTSTTSYGWAKLAFSTVLPKLILVD